MAVDDEEPQLSSLEPSYPYQNQAPELPDFKNLEARAYREAKGIARSSQTLATRLERLAPVLIKMQEILSERGTLHKFYKAQNLPPWEIWATDFVKNTGIEASWATIKRAMSAFSLKRAGSLRSKQAIPAAKLQMASICSATLAGLEIAKALESDTDYASALTHIRETGVTRDTVVRALKRLGIKDVQELSEDDRAAWSESETGSGTYRQRLENPTNIGNYRPGAWSQITGLADLTIGPALRDVLTLDDPVLQSECFEKIVSHLARKWVPFDSNLGEMELSVTFVRRPQPKLASRAA
jgi:hypothetical protein